MGGTARVAAKRTSDVLWTDAMRDRYQRAWPLLQRQVVKVTRSAVRRYVSVDDWFDGKKALQGVRDNVYELRVTQSDGGLRLLVMDDGRHLVLLALEDHAGVERFARDWARDGTKHLATVHDAPQAFSSLDPPAIFVDVDGETEPQHEEELDKSWLWFLSDEQAVVADRLFQSVTADDASTYVAYLTGGAGTGKTAILLSLAMRLDVSGRNVEFKCSTPLAQHLRQYAGINIDRFRRATRSGSVVLVDDPLGPEDVRERVYTASLASSSAVIAFDPLQWRDKKLRTSITRLPKAEEYRLSTCYRQAENVAAQALDFVATVHNLSSWRVDPVKIAQERDFLKDLEDLYLSGMQFVKPGGRVRLVEPTEAREAFAQEAHRLQTSWHRWKDLPGLLLLEDQRHGIHLSKKTREALAGIKMLTAPLDAVGRYRGLEFQAVWILLDETFYNAIRAGKAGLGSEDWALMDLHVPLTRAKDELVVFLWDPKWN